MSDNEIAKALLEALLRMGAIFQDTGATSIQIEVSYDDDGLEVTLGTDNDRVRRVGEKVMAMLARESEKQSRKEESA